MGKKIRIKSFELSDEIFDKILYDFSSRIKIVPSTDPYLYGYKNKNDIYYDNKEYLICKEYIINYYCHNIEYCTDWKQVRVRRVENKTEKISNNIDGQRAWQFMLNLLENYYSYEEIKNIFNNYTVEYNKEYAQYHYNYPCNTNKKVFKFENCYKYDINGAHCDAIAEMFPLAKKAILVLYANRKTKPVNKEIINYFVGMLARKGFRLTYNWIVQRTTKLLYKAMDITGGKMIYANTDGYVISMPDNLLNTSKELGDFKLEYSGDIYIYQDTNYWLMQCGDEMKGSCLTSVRKNIDLSKNQVVHYKRKRTEIVEGVFINTAEDIIKEIL